MEAWICGIGAAGPVGASDGLEQPAMAPMAMRAASEERKVDMVGSWCLVDLIEGRRIERPQGGHAMEEGSRLVFAGRVV
jgi:hypothetical protein